MAQRRDATVGFMSTGYLAEVLHDTLTAGLPKGTFFEIRDGTTSLASGGSHHRHDAELTTEATGRTWSVIAANPNGPTRWLAGLIAGVTVLLTGALAMLWRRTNRYDDQVLRSTTHLQALAGFATGLAPRRSSDDVMSYLTSGVLAPLDGIHAAVGVVEGDRLKRYFTPGPLAQATRTALPATNPLSADTPLTVAARTDEAVLLASTAEMRDRYPHLADAWMAAGFGATANLPLHDRQGAVIGALGVAWDRPVEFDADLVGRLTTVAGIAGQSLERARLADAEHRLVDALQTDVLAPLPHSEHLACAARYLPASQSRRDGGRLVRGDRARRRPLRGGGRRHRRPRDHRGRADGAVPHDARHADPPRHAPRRADRAGVALGRGHGAHRHRRGRGDRPGGRHARLRGRRPPAAAPAPARRHHARSSATVAARSSASPARPTRPAPTTFPIGATLLCYTDGLIERRSESIDLSVRRLAEQLAGLSAGDPERMADSLLEACLPPGEQTDDVALALITRRS